MTPEAKQLRADLERAGIYNFTYPEAEQRDDDHTASRKSIAAGVCIGIAVWIIAGAFAWAVFHG